MLDTERVGSFNVEIEDDIPILPDDKQFLLRECTRSHREKLLIIHRTKRRVGELDVELVVLNTINVDSFVNLRLEQIDDRCFIVNDPENDVHKSMRISVINEEVGRAIIKEIMSCASREIQKPKADGLTLSDVYWRVNELVERSSALIFSFCTVLLTFSASFWFLFK